MSFILILKSLFRAMFYPMPKVGDVYSYDVWDIGNPWSNNIEHNVQVIDVKRGWIKYKKLGDCEKYNICQNQTSSRFEFHAIYKKVNEAPKV